MERMNRWMKEPKNTKKRNEEGWGINERRKEQIRELIIEGVRMGGNQGRRKEYKWTKDRIDWINEWMMSGWKEKKKCLKEQMNKWKEGKNDWKKEGGGMNDGKKEEQNRGMN